MHAGPSFEAVTDRAGVTVIVALPEKVPGPFASEKAVSVYVVVVVGDTVRVAGNPAPAEGGGGVDVTV